MVPLTFFFVVYQWLWPRFLSGYLPKLGNHKKTSPDLATVTTDMSMKEHENAAEEATKLPVLRMASYLLSTGREHSEATRATGLFSSEAYESDRQMQVV
jgi:hypothetical protein